MSAYNNSYDIAPSNYGLAHNSSYAMTNRNSDLDSDHGWAYDDSESEDGESDYDEVDYYELCYNEASHNAIRSTFKNGSMETVYRVNPITGHPNIYVSPESVNAIQGNVTERPYFFHYNHVTKKFDRDVADSGIQVDSALNYGLQQKYQPSGQVPPILTTPFPEDFPNTPEHPQDFLPNPIDWNEMTRDEHAKLIEWKARAGTKVDLGPEWLIPRLMNVPQKVNNVQRALSERDQRARRKRGMFNSCCRMNQIQKNTKARAMPARVREIFDNLTDLQLLYRTVGTINFGRMAFSLGGQEYPLKEPEDLPENYRSGLAAALRREPSVEEHFEANPQLRDHFRPVQHGNRDAEASSAQGCGDPRTDFVFRADTISTNFQPARPARLAHDSHQGLASPHTGFKVGPYLVPSIDGRCEPHNAYGIVPPRSGAGHIQSGIPPTNNSNTASYQDLADHLYDAQCKSDQGFSAPLNLDQGHDGPYYRHEQNATQYYPQVSQYYLQLPQNDDRNVDALLHNQDVGGNHHAHQHSAMTNPAMTNFFSMPIDPSLIAPIESQYLPLGAQSTSRGDFSSHRSISETKRARVKASRGTYHTRDSEGKGIHPGPHRTDTIYHSPVARKRVKRSPTPRRDFGFDATMITQSLFDLIPTVFSQSEIDARYATQQDSRSTKQLEYPGNLTSFDDFSGEDDTDETNTNPVQNNWSDSFEVLPHSGPAMSPQELDELAFDGDAYHSWSASRAPLSDITNHAESDSGPPPRSHKTKARRRSPHLKHQNSPSHNKGRHRHTPY